MLKLDFHRAGRHFLQIPGPSPVPDRILRAMSLPTIDHRGPEFGALGRKVLSGIREVFKTRHPVVIYPSSGTGAWEAALANTMSPGDHVVMYETGHFATLWHEDGGAARARDRVPRVAGQRRAPAARAELAARRAGRPDRGSPAPRHRAAHQGGVRRAQRNVDRRHVRHRVGAPRHRRREAPRAADGRHDLGPGERRLPARRMGCRRDDRRLAEGPDAAAGHRLQRALAARARGGEDGAAAALVLGVGRDRRDEQGRLLAVHAEHQSAVWLVRVARHAARRRARQRVRAPRSAGPQACAPRSMPGACRSSAPTRASIRRCSPA